MGFAAVRAGHQKLQRELTKTGRGYGDVGDSYRRINGYWA
jgi:hypothetical protein